MTKRLRLILTRVGISGLVILFLGACSSKKDILYMQDIESMEAMTTDNYNPPTIRANDILKINVASFDMEAAMPFNLIQPARNISELGRTNNREIQGYIVNNDGTIEFPVLGTLEVAGKTRQELVTFLKKEIGAYLKDPIINIEIINYKITVLGEVNRPGTFTISNERITLLEALGMAGDLNIYGKRNNILLLREDNGQRIYHKIDITQSDFIQSPFYYLKQNDVLYVQPNSAQVGAAAYNRNATVYISIASVLISIAVLITR